MIVRCCCVTPCREETLRKTERHSAMSPFHPTVTGLVAVADAVTARGASMIPRASDAPDAIDGLRVRAAPVGEPDQVEWYGPTGDALNLPENWKTGEDSFFVDDLV